MITRAQAEALLTLAESLEACERLDMAVVTAHAEIRNGFSRYAVDTSKHGELNAVSVRLAVNALVPKHTGP